ncbi:MAG: hypothetical protein HY001_00995 [Candidatus Portnoybacteria bacterium]|nr:hypothetical protein [Candidatus Portnoybacteria bacterium]
MNHKKLFIGIGIGVIISIAALSTINKELRAAGDLFTITSPQSGSTWQLSTSVTISWTKNPGTIDHDIILELLHSGGAANIGRVNSAAGSTTLVLQSYLDPAKSPYTLRFLNAAAYSSDESPCTIALGNYGKTCGRIIEAEVSNIIIIPSDKAITVTAPSEGEKILQGSTYAIRWSTTGTIPKANIALYQFPQSQSSGSVGTVTLPGENIPNTGSYEWNVPYNIPPGDLYILRVYDSSDPYIGGAVSISDFPTPPPSAKGPVGVGASLLLAVAGGKQGWSGYFSITSGELTDGVLVREQSSKTVWIIKVLPNGKRFKRHVLTEDMGKWYKHLAPFWARVKVVSDGTLSGYKLSSWVRLPITNNPRTWRIFEVNDDGTKHWITCADSDNCGGTWIARGGDPDGIFTISTQEMNFYRSGASVFLR